MRKRKLILSIILITLLILVLVWYIASYNGEGVSALRGVVLSEVMSSNKGSVADAYGDYPDWIELYNTMDKDVDISGYGLSDDVLAGPKYIFPSGTTLKANGYIVVFCSGAAVDSMHASFKISASDTLMLYDASGLTLESLTLNAVPAGQSYARSTDGGFVATEPSPGYENSAAGAAAYQASRGKGEDIGVYINEFMASNKTVIADQYGVYSDWIELYNSTNRDVNLSGYGISDNLSQPVKYKLPQGTVIPAKGYLIIFCSGNESTDASGEIHAPFSLRAYEEDVVFSNPSGQVIDSYSYSRMEADQSMARMPDGTGSFGLSGKPTPGYANTDDGYSAFMAAMSTQVGSLYISEIMGANLTAHKAPDGAYYDWVELHNAGTSAIDLSGYGLSDNVNNPAKWVFSAITIEPGEYLILYASGDSSGGSTEKKNLHLNFKISAEGETVYLFNPAGEIVDKLAAGRFLEDVSYGRQADLRFAYFTASTPGSANNTGKAGLTESPSFSVTPGIYGEAVTLSITAGEGESIYYTTDCSAPSSRSTLYTGPITISKNTVIRAVSVKENYITGRAASGTYLFTSDGVNHSLPVVTLVTDPDNLWDSKTGIYAYGEDYDASLPYGKSLETANFFEDGDEWERPATFEVFGGDGIREFAQDIGISIAGAYGRGRAQKGFNIIARDEYGEDRMAYAFFDNLEFTEYKAVVLRAGGQDQNRSKIRDELAVEILEGTDVDFLYQSYRPVVLYLNGEYWGVYFLKEKRNRFFVAQHEDTANVTDMDIGKASSRVSYGTKEEWTAFMNYVSSHDLSVQSNYDYVCSQMDINSFIDYMVCELYTGNSDYANIQYYKLPGGKWKWIYYDFCWGFSNYDHQTLSLRRGSVPAASGLFNALLENKAWRTAFLERFAELLNTAFAPERVIEKIDKLYALVEPEIAREREKFNGKTFMGVQQKDENIGSYDSFVRQIDYLKTFAQKRPQILKDMIQKEFGLSDAYMKEVFG